MAHIQRPEEKMSLVEWILIVALSALIAFMITAGVYGVYQQNLEQQITKDNQ